MNNKLKNRIINQSKKIYDIKAGDPYLHISFLIYRNKIVSWGKNSREKTCPLAQRHNYEYFRVHSELAVIKNFPYPISELSAYTIVNLRINKRKELMQSRPCDCCINLLSFFGITSILYSNEKGEFVSL